MTSLYDSILANQYYPVGMQRVMLDQLTDAGVPVVDPTNPVVFTLKAATTLTAMALEKYSALLRRQYPVLAQTLSDIKYHLSDKDYLNLYAKPSTVTLLVAFDKNEILNKLVLDPETGVSRLTIPRNTYFTISGQTTLSMQYPIHIEKLRHGGISITYDTEIQAMDYALSTNLVPHYESNVEGVDWLVMEIKVHQFRVSQYKDTISSAAPVKVTIPLIDQFYYARVYLENNDGSWTELKTTHSDVVYDVATPTAVIDVGVDTVNVSIPQVYVTAGITLSQLRVDLYETYGDLTMDISSYPSDAIAINWFNLDSNEDTIYSAPLKNLTTVRVMSDAVTTGGRDALSFAEIRERVINHTVGEQILPITPSQIQTAMADDSYTIVKNIDGLTDRVFLATRSLPAPTNPKLITAAAIGMQDLITSFQDALSLDTVIDNGSSITITPDTLFQINGGVLSFVNRLQRNALLVMPADKRAAAVSTGNYYYTPFHYVLDTKNSEFDVRPYYLTKPAVLYKTFMDQNDTTGLQVAIDSVSLEKVSTGYTLTMVTSSSQDFRELNDGEVFVQLSYLPYGEKFTAFLNGSLIGKTEDGERIYRFDLSTSHYVDINDHLELLPFAMFDGQASSTFSPLTGVFDVLFSTNSAMPTSWVQSGMDRDLGTDLLPSGVAAITWEQVCLQFGSSLDYLWAQRRTITSSIQYETYPEDVYATYAQDVYEIDPVTGSAVKIVNGEVTYTLLHAKGDVIRDASNNPVVKYRAGDVIINPVTGSGIIKAPRGIQRQFSIALVEGAYYFATDSVASSYRQEINDTLVGWITNDLEEINQSLLEKTDVFFYPKATLGQIQAIVDNTKMVQMAAGQAFTLSLYVSKTVYDDARLRLQLENKTVSVLAKQLAQATISMSDIIEALKAEYGLDVVSFTISGLENNAYRVASMVSDANRLGIRKRLTAQGDGSLIVEEDLTFNYYRHDNNS